MNLFAYVFNSPSNLVDPTGLDTTVLYFTPGPGASHIAVRVGAGPVYGFYPVSKSLRTVLSLDVPGELRVAFDRPENASVSVVIATSRQEEARIHAYLEQILGQQRLAAHGVGVPPTYNLAGRNCATLVGDALRAGGIDSSTSAIPLYFIRDLQQLHGAGVNVWPMP